MPAYVLGNVEIVERDAFAPYAAGVAATVERYGGRFLVRGSGTLVEGDLHPDRVVLIEFPSMERLREWWTSVEYAPLKELRLRTARSTFLFMEGLG